MNRSGERLTAAIAVALLAGGLAACSSPSAPTPTVQSTAAPANDSSSPEWLAVGDEIRRLSKNIPIPCEPLDITGPTTYQFICGPVTENVQLPRGFSAPPDAGELNLRPVWAGNEQFVIRGGKRYVETTIEVRSPTASYRGLRLWLQASPSPTGMHRAAAEQSA